PFGLPRTARGVPACLDGAAGTGCERRRMSRHNAAADLAAANPWSIAWTGPGILLASLMIAWGAECAQFFVAQGLALAILAWLQTLPEFAVEAVLGYHQQSQYLLANLTGALRLLTGLGWPMIYFSAAMAYRAR